MKCFVCLLLSCCILLSLWGCGSTAPAETTAPATTAPSTEPVAVTEPEPAVFSLKKLPEIGDYVSDEKVAYFFPDGAQEAFEPRDDYGEIVPYCPLTERFFAIDWSYEDPETGEVYSGSTEKSEEGYFEKYGFSTTDGKIITEGIYEDVVEVRAESGERIYVAFPKQTYEMCGEMDIIGADGSWMLRFDSQVDFRNMEYRVWTYTPMFIISAEDQDQIFDFNGHLVRDVSWVQKGSFVLPEIHYIDEDQILVEEEIPDGEYSKEAIRLYDKDNKLLSTFPEETTNIKDVTPEGIVIASSEDETYRLLDLSGNPLNKTTYYEVVYDKQNACFYAEPDYDASIIEVLDKTGKKIRTLDCPYYELQRDEDIIWLFDDSNYVIHDFNGNEVPLDVDGKEIEKTETLTDWDTDDDNLKVCFYAVTPNDTLYVFDTLGHRLAVLPNVEYEEYERYDDYDDEDEDEPKELEKSYHIGLDNNYLIYQQKGRCCIQSLVSKAKRSFPITDPENYRGVTMAGNRLYSVDYFTTDGTWNSMIRLYDFATNKCLLKNAVKLEQFGNMILVLTKTHSYILDKSGNKILCLKNDKLV